VFAGPGKGADELEYVIVNGIGEIHLETEIELACVAAIGGERNIKVPVGVRFNPQNQMQGGAMRMGGKAAPFGFDEEALDQVIDRIEQSPHLDFKGIHLFAGTQILNADLLHAQWRYAIELAAAIGERRGCPVATVDLGGGLGIPYFKGDRPLDLARLKQLAAPLFEDAAVKLPGAKIILEPGRFLAGSAGLYLCRVRAVKRSRGETFVVIDGGMHHHLAASGNLGQVIKKDYPQVLANRLAAVDEISATVVGPLCTPLDTIGRHVVMPMPRPGDLLAVLQSGAYGLSASPNGFLSHPMPAEVLLDRGIARLIRERGSFEQPITPLP
jgi:diaminopimelate decarboxylase